MLSNLPNKGGYPKLVRDRIPEIIGKKGLIAKTRILDDDEFLRFLLKKMIEESAELQHSLNKGNMEEELADILELIGELIKLKGWKKENIVAIQKKKRKKNGGFKKKILLLEKP